MEPEAGLETEEVQSVAMMAHPRECVPGAPGVACLLKHNQQDCRA